MNRRDFFKLIGAASVIPAAVNATTEQDISHDYYVECYTQREKTLPYSKHKDLWTSPTPRFVSLDSAREFIDDHSQTFNFNHIDVYYITYYKDVTGRDMMVGTSYFCKSHNNSWYDKEAKHCRTDYDII